ncbi:MAG: tRNA 2-selenouridine(34) synthase MnmH [Rhodospirillales bacterium]|nr:tRNA 2-selenouridine(34) synthase MnmH [Rhodospirillales bacterium]
MSDHLIPATQFRELFLANTPFLDVRAEVEFAKGRFPTSHNLPILNDAERQRVGTCYKQEGRAAAIELGHSLVTGQTKAARIEAWCQFATAHPGAHLYCWRGGMRSNFARQWMHEAGVDMPLIDGGFKALRRVLIDEIDDAAGGLTMLRIGGKTGTAKTVLINAIDGSIDLEAHANHRGSSFGRRVSGVPSQVDFENALGIDLLQKRHAFPGRTLVFEDESRRIGACAIPQAFFDRLHASPVAIVEMPLAFRIQRIAQEYVIDMSREFAEAYPADGWELFVDYLTQSLVRVQKRLGMERFRNIAEQMDDALALQKASGDCSRHEAWIRALLNDYYDPMYDYQLAKQADAIAFRGSYDDVLEWTRENSQRQPGLVDA